MSNPEKEKQAFSKQSSPPNPYHDATEDPSALPPPYSTSDTYRPPPEKGTPPLQSTSSNTAQPPQRQYAPPKTPQIFHVYRDSMMNRNMTVHDTAKRPCYSVAGNIGAFFSQKPNMRVYNCPEAQQATTRPVGTVSYHYVGWDIDLELYGYPVVMTKSSIFGRAHQYPSRIFGGTVRWEADGPMTNNLSCLDSRGGVLARWDNNPMSVDKRGKLLVGDWNIQGQALDELVVGCLAMVEWIRRQQK